MKLKVYCVYDSKGENFGKPAFYDNRAEALRSWQEAIADAQCPYSKYPNDFTLFEIGEWDRMAGEFSLYEAKLSLGLAVEYKNSAVASN